MESTYCYDCLSDNNKNEKRRQKLAEAWEQVKPVSKEYPKRTESGHEHENLPYLECGDKAVISPVHPVVTVKKNHYANKKLRLESISLVQDPVPAWSKILPRTSLADHFLIIEQRARDSSKRYIVANMETVRQWLLYLFEKHPEFIKLSQNNELQMSTEALEALRLNEQLFSRTSNWTWLLHLATEIMYRNLVCE